MPTKPKFDPAIHDENPDWTEADFAKSRPASDMPPELLAQFRNKVGRPRIANPKVPVKIRLDDVVVDALRATGPGWQTRINDMLKSRISRGKIRFDQPPEPKRKKA